MAEEQDLLAAAPAGADTSASQDDGKRAVEEWAELLYPDSAYGIPHRERWHHGAAGALHGWALHAQHANEPMRLSEADYRAAIQAATKFEGGRYVAHEAARSPYLQQPDADTDGQDVDAQDADAALVRADAKERV